MWRQPEIRRTLTLWRGRIPKLGPWLAQHPYDATGANQTRPVDDDARIEREPGNDFDDPWDASTDLHFDVLCPVFFVENHHELTGSSRHERLLRQRDRVRECQGLAARVAGPWIEVIRVDHTGEQHIFISQPSPAGLEISVCCSKN